MYLKSMSQKSMCPNGNVSNVNMSIMQLLKVEVPKKSVSSKFNSFIHKNDIKYVHIDFYDIFVVPTL